MSGGGGGTSPTTSATAGGGSTTSTGGLGGLLAPLAQQLTAQGPNFGGGSFVGPPVTPPWGTTQQSKADYYNQQLSRGLTDAQIRANIEANPLGGAQSNSDWSYLVQQAGMQSPTGRPLPGSGQFYQPVYQQQYQNYARPATQFDVSTYGTQPVLSPAAESGASRESINRSITDYFRANPNAPISQTLDAMRGSGINRTDIQQWGGYNNFGPQMQTPFSYSGQPSMLGQAVDFGPAQPLSDSALQRISSQRQAAEADAARGGDTVTTSMPGGSTQTRAMFPSGMPQMQTPFSMFGGQMQGGGYGQYGENNPYSPYSNTFLNMPSNLNRMGQADKVGFYQGAMGRGFNDQQMYNQASGLFGYQSPQDWSYLQNQAMQMQSPFRSSGPAQPIVSRSAGVRGTPNVIRRAEGGIASLIGDE